jgi:hypothetical protein
VNYEDRFKDLDAEIEERRFAGLLWSGSSLIGAIKILIVELRALRESLQERS